MLLYVLWVPVALLVVHDIDRAVKWGGVYAVEAMGGYLVGRRYIRSEAQFHSLSRLIVIIVIALAFLSVPEALTGRNLVRPWGAFSGERRMGLARATAVFEHPILYGVFCAGAIGMAWYSQANSERASVRTNLLTGLVMLSAAMSVSSGAVAAIMTQVLVIAYDRFTQTLHRRWLFFAVLLLSAYCAILLLSNRTPLTVILYYLTFSPDTAYGRVVIFDGGTAAIAKSPIFGIGFNDWDHPTWMSNSMDNFWLVVPVMYGLPAFVGLAGAALYLIFGVFCARPRSRGQKAWLVSMLGMSVAACTVHFWNSLFVYFCFFIGAGVALLDGAPAYLARGRGTVQRDAGSASNVHSM